MWKVLVVVCSLGNPCTMFVEEPIKYYHSEKECMMMAGKKAKDLIDTHIEYGYTIDSQAYSCEFLPQLGTI